MILEALTLVSLFDGIKVALTLISFASIIFGVFKLVFWVKDKLNTTNEKIDVLNTTITNKIDNLNAILTDKLGDILNEVKAQTISLVQEQRETRQEQRDTRQMLTSVIFPSIMKPAPLTARAKPTKTRKKVDR